MPNLGFVLKGIKGNGMTLGLTNGSQNGGLVEYTFQTINHAGVSQSAYGKNISTSANVDPMVFGNIGITTDSLKSGIEVKVSDGVNYIIKY